MSYTSKKTAGARSTGLIVVVALHIVLVWGLASGLATEAKKKLEEEIKVVLDEAPEQPDDPDLPPPPPPDPSIPPPPIDPVIMPEFTTATEAPADYHPPVNVTPQAKVAPQVTAKPAQMPKKPLSLPDYPPASQRAGEEGVVQLQLYLNEEGRVTEANIAKSSGFPRLDEAAAKHAKRSWKLVPCMEGDKPVACWYTMNWRWQLPK